MKIISAPFDKELIDDDVCACIGFFDGVHRGHQFLISQLIKEARHRGQSSAVITFRNHPSRLINPDAPLQMLSPFDEKIRLLSATGIDYCFVLDFTPQLRNLTAQQFISIILFSQLRTRTLIIGYDHRFGKDRSEGFEDYRHYGAQIGMQVIKESDFSPMGMHISSSAIRKEIAKGEVEAAAGMLSRPYNIKGKVESGFQIGRTIGFPTANITPVDEQQLIPANGVYVIETQIQGRKYFGMLNIGTRPTLHDDHIIVMEVNIFEFSGNLYGQMLDISLLKFLRQEQKMDSLQALKEQLQRDRINAQLYISQHK